MNTQPRPLRFALPVLLTAALTALLLVPPAPVRAQDQAVAPVPPAQYALDQKIPVDPRITVGELPNGLRYWIRENKEPKNRAELRLVV